MMTAKSASNVSFVDGDAGLSGTCGTAGGSVSCCEGAIVQTDVGRPLPRAQQVLRAPCWSRHLQVLRAPCWSRRLQVLRAP